RLRQGAARRHEEGDGDAIGSSGRPHAEQRMSSRIRSALPYAIGLGVAVLLFISASHIQYTPRPGQIGPDFWPKIAIALMAVVCLIEIVRALVGAADARG